MCGHGGVLYSIRFSPPCWLAKLIWSHFMNESTSSPSTSLATDKNSEGALHMIVMDGESSKSELTLCGKDWESLAKSIDMCSLAAALSRTCSQYVKVDVPIKFEWRFKAMEGGEVRTRP